MTGAGLKKLRRLRLIGLAAVTLAAATALIGYAMRDGIAFFRSPSQILAAPPPPHERFRLGGMVATGSLSREGDVAHFDIEDGQAQIAVAYRGILPDLFAEGEGTVATGHYRDGLFVANEVLAKHDETDCRARSARSWALLQGHEADDRKRGAGRSPATSHENTVESTVPGELTGEAICACHELVFRMFRQGRETTEPCR